MFVKTDPTSGVIERGNVADIHNFSGSVDMSDVIYQRFVFIKNEKNTLFKVHFNFTLILGFLPKTMISFLLFIFLNGRANEDKSLRKIWMSNIIWINGCVDLCYI